MKKALVFCLSLLMVFNIILTAGCKVDPVKDYVEVKIMEETTVLWTSGEVEKGSTINVPSLEKADYTYKIYSDSAMKTEAQIPTTASENATYYVKYTVNNVEVKVLEGSNVVWNSGEVKIGSTLSVPSFEKAGYTYKIYSDSAMTTETTIASTVSKSATYYIKYIVNNVQMKIMDGDTVLWQSGTVAYGSEISPSSLEKAGYNYKFYSDAALKTEIDLPTTAEATDKTYYIKYFANKYVIKFDCGDGMQFAPVNATYDEYLYLPNSNLFDGSFIGWSKTANSLDVDYAEGSRIKNITSEKDGEVTLYAIFDSIDASSFKIKDGVITAYTGTSRSIRLPNAATKVAPEAFAHNDTIFRVIVPEHYTEIGQGAFMDCPYLTQLQIPFIGGSRTENRFLAYIFGADEYDANDYYKSVKYSSYSGISPLKTDLSSQYIPTALRTVILTGEQVDIPEGAFYRHYALERLVFKDSSKLVTIGKNAFNGTQALGADQLIGSAYELYWLETVENFGAGCFEAYDCEAFQLSYVTWEYDDYIGSISLTSIMEIPTLTNAKVIDENAFAGQNLITSIKFGNRLTTIGDAAFYNTSSIAMLDIPNSVQSIGYMAFAYSGLTYVNIGTGIKSIDRFAFVSETLVEVMFKGTTIPDIAPNAFGNELVKENGEYTLKLYGNQLGIFIHTSKVADLRDEAGAKYTDAIQAIDESKAGKVYYYLIGNYYSSNNGQSIKARLTTTAGHAMIVEDPQGKFANAFLQTDYNSIYYNSTYAISLDPLESAPMYSEDKVLNLETNKYETTKRYALEGKDYYVAMSGDTWRDYTICLDTVLFTNPETGERSLIPAFIDRAYFHGYQYGRVASEGSYLMNTDKYGNVVYLYKYVKNADGDLELEKVVGPEGTAFTKIVNVKDGGASSTSEYTIVYFNSANKVLAEKTFIIDPKKSDYTVADFQMIEKPVVVDNHNDDEDKGGIELDFFGIASAAMEIELSVSLSFVVNIYGPGAFTVIVGDYKIPANSPAFGEEGFYVELSNFNDILEVFEPDGKGTLTFTEYFDGAYHAVELITECQAWVPDMLSADEYNVYDISFISFAGEHKDIKTFVNFDGSQEIEWFDIGDTAYIHVYENSDSTRHVVSSGIAVKNGDSYDYTEKYTYDLTVENEVIEFVSYFKVDPTYGWTDCLCAQSYGSITDCICGGTCWDSYPDEDCGCGADKVTSTEYNLVYAASTKELTITFEEGSSCIFFGTEDFHRGCDAGSYKGSNSTNLDLDGNGKGVFTKEDGTEIKGDYVAIEKAVYVSYSSWLGGYYTSSMNQYYFASEKGDFDFYFTVSESYTEGKIFAKLMAKDRDVFTVYDMKGYKVGELRLTVMGDYSYIEYTYTFDENGKVVYSDPIVTGYCASRIAGIDGEGNAIPFYYIVVDEGCNIMFYLDIVDAVKNICIIDDYTRLASVPTMETTQHAFLPTASECTPIVELQ